MLRATCYCSLRFLPDFRRDERWNRNDRPIGLVALADGVTRGQVLLHAFAQWALGGNVAIVCALALVGGIAYDRDHGRQNPPWLASFEPWMIPLPTFHLTWRRNALRREHYGQPRSRHAGDNS